jgi:hypothetical protein
VSPSVNDVAEASKVNSVPTGYPYLYPPLSNAQVLNLNVHANSSKQDKDLITDLLPEDRRTTGYYTIYCGVMQQTFI